MKKLVTAIVSTAAVLAFAGSASAQSAQTIEVTPASVDAAGSTDLTVSIGGFTAGATVFVLPCTVPASGNAADIGDGDCDTAQLLTADIGADGTASVSVTYDIPAGGLVVAVSDADGVERAQIIVGVGGGGGDAPAEEPAGETPAAPEDLPDTGSELTIALFGAATLLAGAGLLVASRRNEPLVYVTE